MTTDNERQQVAAMLRESVHTDEYLDRAIANALLETGGEQQRPIADVLADLIEPQPIDGETSDGYHTFNELYHHRAVLFSVIVAVFSDRAWKSKKHADGTMYDGMFIVGINTPDGQATYHYDIDPYWNMFRCKEVERAPEWDGHTPEQAIERIGKLADLVGRTCRIESVEPIEYGERNETIGYWFNLSCGHYVEKQYDDMIPKFCDKCGAKVITGD